MMSVDKVAQAMVQNAVQGLYLTRDLDVVSPFTSRLLREPIDRFHQRQPVSEDYDLFADQVSDAYQTWSRRQSASLREFTAHLMLAGGLTMTHPQITWGLAAAVDVALAVHLRTIGAADDAIYPRLIPSALADMQIASFKQIHTETFERILRVEPWLSWLERLRSQRRRMLTALQDPFLRQAIVTGTAQMAAAGAGIAGQTRQGDHVRLRAAHKSIRKSVALHTKLGSLSDLRVFLQSTPTQSFTPPALVIEGKRYDYHLRLSPDSLIDFTINTDSRLAPTSADIYNKQGRRLCRVCVYFRNTPILDHVMATSLMVRNAETEMDVLKTMAVVLAPRAFYDDPVLPQLKGLRQPALIPTLVENVYRNAMTLDGDQAEMASLMQAVATPSAFRAFRHMLGCEASYVTTLANCAGHSVDDFLLGEPAAMVALVAAQRSSGEGHF